MRYLLVIGLAVATLLGLPHPARAQIVIQEIRAGFPAYGKDAGRTYYKAGAWVPLAITVRAGAEGFLGGQLIVETTDSDDVRNRFSVPVPELSPDPDGKKPVLIFGYTRPGSVGAAVRVSIRDAQNREQTFTGNLDAEPLDFSKQLYLVLGSRPTDLPEGLRGMEPDPQRLRIRYAAAVEQVQHLPTRWFGYNGVDLLILTTGRPDFLDALAGDKERRQALAEWVQRGGRLFVSISPRHLKQVANFLSSWKPALPTVVTTEALQFQSLEGPVQFGEIPGAQPFQARDGARVEMARLRVRGQGVGPVEILAQEKEKLPLLIRVPYGMGSVTLLAIGLDDEPFIQWEGRTQFWQKLVNRLGPAGVVGGSNSSGSRASAAAENDLATSLQKELETFPDVPLVPFGLVALLIFLFILVVGPLDYFFLKKVVKRLEWTWATYLILVSAVSVLAFFGASGLQDKGLLVNEVTLLDIDQLDPRTEARVVGTTWFTLFSPRLQSYTVSVAPAPEWARSPSAVLLTWMGRSEVSGLNSTGRQRSETLFRAGYDYGPKEGELSAVPVPFAGTKTFTASWQAVLPLRFEARLFYETNQGVIAGVAGTVVNPLHVELQDAVLSYGGKWFTFTGRLLPGQKVAVAPDDRAIQFDEWAFYRKEAQQGQPGSFQTVRLLRTILFHEKLDPRGTRRDHFLRRLDQSWRTYEPNTREVPVQMAILYGRLPRVEGNSAPGLPDRLQISETGAGSKPLLPALTQDVFVRVYLPVFPGKKKE